MRADALAEEHHALGFVEAQAVVERVAPPVIQGGVRAQFRAAQPAGPRFYGLQQRAGDLKGKRIAHTSPSSNSGNLAPRALFPKIGLTPDTDYKVTPDALERAITPRTKWLMMNAPSNPTGSVYTADELRGLTAVLERHPHVWLMTDDIYARLNFTDAPTVHPLQVAPALAARTLVVNGVSKAYAMTGWRIGYGAGPDELIKAMAILQSQSTSGASSATGVRAPRGKWGVSGCGSSRSAIQNARSRSHHRARARVGAR